jgi:hypothetical protein
MLVEEFVFEMEEFVLKRRLCNKTETKSPIYEKER